MEQRNVVQRGIAQGLNAVGSALVVVYDAAASTLGLAWPGEKEKPKGKIKEYEKKIERLYFEIGKEVSNEEGRTQVSAVGEAGLKLIAEYRNEIKRIKQGIQEILEAEKIAKQQALQEKEAGQRMKRPEAKEPAPISEKSAPGEEIAQEAEPGAPAEPSLPEARTEAEKRIEVGEAETPPEALPEEASAVEVPVAVGPSPEAEAEEEKPAEAEEAETPAEELQEHIPERLENMLKVDLLALGTEKGIEVDRKMTKAEIIELILNHQG